MTDFGNTRIAKSSDREGKILSSTPLCTISYAAPESYEIRGNYDMIVADIFSLGS
jgi:serine/threonine protein kinase